MSKTNNKGGVGSEVHFWTKDAVSNLAGQDGCLNLMISKLAKFRVKRG